MPIGDPNRGLENTTAPQYLTDDSFEKRITLINGFDKKFREKFKVKKVQSYTDFYAEATSEEITIDPNELVDAKWFTRDQLRNPRDHGFLLPRGDSIASRLIADWIAAG